MFVFCHPKKKQALPRLYYIVVWKSWLHIVIWNFVVKRRFRFVLYCRSPALDFLKKGFFLIESSPTWCNDIMMTNDLVVGFLLHNCILSGQKVLLGII